MIPRSINRLDFSRSWQKAQLLPGLHRGAGQHDARNFVAIEGCDRHRHREVRLARAGGADRKDDVALVHRLDIPALIEVLGLDSTPTADRRQNVLGGVPEVRIGLFGNHPHRLANIASAHLAPGSNNAVELFQDLAREFDLVGVSDQPDLVATRLRIDPEISLQRT